MRNKICIGTMLWGSRTSEDEAHKIINYAIDNSINFFDTAEVYPTFPYSKKTQGQSETILGNWIKKNKEEIKISTKMKSPAIPEEIENSVNCSLRRLNVDSIDYYQLHWPNREHYHFRNLWNFDPTKQNPTQTLEFMYKVLNELNNLVKQGKIKKIGMSNETAWGITRWQQVAKENNFVNLSVIQNEYSLLHRLFDLDVAEACYNENIKLLAWTPLAGGLLTGKYSKQFSPKNSRRTYGGLGPRDNENVWKPIEEYQKIAEKYDVDLTHLSLAWIDKNPLLESTILGVSTCEQLRHNLNFKKINLSKDVINDIQEVYKKYPIPF